MRRGHVSDPKLPAGRLAAVIPPAIEQHDRAKSDRYCRRDWIADVAAEVGTTTRNVQRWVSAIMHDEPLSLYVLDTLAAREGVALASLYPDRY